MTSRQLIRQAFSDCCQSGCQKWLSDSRLDSCPLKTVYSAVRIDFETADQTAGRWELSIQLSEMTSRQLIRQAFSDCCLFSCQNWLPNSRPDSCQLRTVYPAVRNDFQTADQTAVRWELSIQLSEIASRKQIRQVSEDTCLIESDLPV